MVPKGGPPEGSPRGHKIVIHLESPDGVTYKGSPRRDPTEGVAEMVSLRVLTSEERFQMRHAGWVPWSCFPGEGPEIGGL